MPKISVIIPVYNTVSWLGECLNSVENQSFTDWEAIIVNDASTDNSAEIAQKFCNKDDRFKLIDLPQNLGLGGARNAGCEVAQGDYLLFLDSDDLLPQDILQNMYNKITKYNADLLIGDFYEFKDSSKSSPVLNQGYRASHSFISNFTVVPETFTWHHLKHDYDLIMPSIITTTCCGKLFRHKLWKDLNCKVPGNLRMAEDFIPVKKFIFHAQKIVWLDLCVILYRQHKASATKKRSNKAYEILRAYDFACDEFTDTLKDPIMKEHFETFFVQSIRDHMYNFLSYRHWYGYYKSAATVINNLDLTHHDTAIHGINLQEWSHHSKRTFFHLVCNYVKQRLNLLLE